MADSRKISMPSRPVGRPKKGAAQAYKAAEAACRRNSLHTPFYDNVFDLEEEDGVEIEAQLEQQQNQHPSYYQEQGRFDRPIQQAVTLPPSVQPRIVDTKGKNRNQEPVLLNSDSGEKRDCKLLYSKM